MKNKETLWTLVGIGALLGLGAALMPRKRFSRVPVWDLISEGRLDGLKPSVAAAASQFVQEAFRRGIRLRVTSGFRSMAEQQALYDQGRTEPGDIVTYAKPGQSLHNHGLAFDVVELSPDNRVAYWDNPRWQEIGALGKSYGFEWGGDWNWKDWGHFQVKR